MLLNSRQFKVWKNYRNVNVKSSTKREYRDENVFLKGDRALSKLITLLISNKKEFNHFFKSRSSDIVLLKLGNLNQNAKRFEARNTEGRFHSCERSELRAMRMCERSEQIFSLIFTHFSIKYNKWKLTVGKFVLMTLVFYLRLTIIF